MFRESLPLLIALSLPLAGVAGLLPAGGREAGKAMPVAISAPAGRATPVPVRLSPPASPPLGQPLPVAGVWLNF